MRPFHYAFKVKDLPSTRDFYVRMLGCVEGRSADTWVDFDFFGNQLSAHVSDDMPKLDYCGTVDGVKVPIPHFGCIVSVEVFEKMQQQLQNHDVRFIVPPQTRFPNESGEQRTMFVLDESGNALEFKAFTNEADTF